MRATAAEEGGTASWSGAEGRATVATRERQEAEGGSGSGGTAQCCAG